MGITVARKRSAAVESIAWRAAMPREEMARLMERGEAADLDDGRRISRAREVYKGVRMCAGADGREVPGRPS